MSAQHQKECPLCQHNAQFKFFDYENAKAYDCPSCGQYTITKYAEQKMSGTSADHITEIVKIVKSATDTNIANITLKNIGEDGKYISTEIVPRSGLPLP